MIAALAKQPLWVESLTDEARAKVLQLLNDGLKDATSPREISSVARAIANLERNDIDRTRLILDAEQKDAGSDEEVIDKQRKIREFVEQGRAASEGSPDADLDAESES